MLGNYFTLRHIALDLDKLLTGSALQSAFSQAKNELVLSFNNEYSLVVSCEPSQNAAYVRRSVSRVRKNSLDFFPDSRDVKILSVFIQPADREIVIALQNKTFIYLRLYGSKANVVLADSRREILEAFLHPRELAGRSLDEPHAPIQVLSAEEFETKFHAIGHLPAFAVMKSLHPLFGSVLIREVFYRAGIAEDRTVSQLQPSEVRRLFTTVRELEPELDSPSPRIYSQSEQPVLFALIGLRSLAPLQTELFDSLHDAVRVFLRTSRQRKGLLNKKTALETKLSAELARVERTLSRMAEETAAADRASLYELYGKMLKAHLHLVTRGRNSAKLENIFSPGREMHEIPLDPHLSPARNADRYFARAKKTRQALKETGSRKEELHERYDLVKRLFDEVRLVQTPGTWETFLNEHGDRLAKAGFPVATGSKPAQQPPPFRVFSVEGGFQVWAGKDSRNNDLLTMKHARPNDLWFHARGSGGSHVVLRMGSGKGEVSRKAVEQAASIAAYYSKMKSSKLVPVAMTQRKYVRKPRGAPAGTVAIEREKVLMVEPRLPGDRDHRS